MSYSGDVVYTVVFLDPAQFAHFVQPFYKPVAYKQTHMLINEEWCTSILDLVPRRSGSTPCKVKVNPDVIQPIVKINRID